MYDRTLLKTLYLFCNKSFENLLTMVYVSLLKVNLMFVTIPSRTDFCDLNTFLLQHPKLLWGKTCVFAEVFGKVAGIGKAAADRNLVNGHFPML